jgi:Tfp pilus assembly protein PilO
MVLVGLCVAVVVAVITFLPNPPTGTRSLTEERKSGRAVAAELARAREEVAELEEAIEKRIVTGTPRRLVREMVQSSQAAAKTAGLQIDDLKPLELRSTPGFRRVPVQISLSAPFPKVARFLYELQRHQDRYHVDQLRMSTANNQTDRLDIELQLVAFVQGDESDAGS